MFTQCCFRKEIRMSYDAANSIPPGARIKVIGIGGGGGNAINTMIRANLEGVTFITGNTDVQSLRLSLATTKIQLGKELTKGLGAGADPDIGRDAALEDRHAIQEAIGDADMVFITAGMGGGTGTGGASIVAQIAREMGALTVAVVTKPFNFEGKRRQKQAELGIQRLRESVDTLITIPNQRLLQVASPDLTMVNAFQMADNVLLNAVKGISDIINIPGTINVDFADVKTVMSCMGQALMGIGSARGENRAAEAARQAISSPLLEDVDIMGATGILINISAGSNVTLMEVNEACSIVQEAAHEDANIIFGAVIDENLSDEIRVTVIATGFPTEASPDLDSRYEIPVPKKSILKAPVRSHDRRITSSYQSSEPVRTPITSAPKRREFEGWMNQPPVVSQPVFNAPTQEVEPIVAVPSPFTSVGEAQELAQLTFGDNSELSLEQESVEPQFNLEAEHDEYFEVSVEASEPRLNFERPGAAAAGMPMASSSDEEACFDLTLDEKLDQALELAEKLRADVDLVDEDEFLDIPAFLRSTNKDLGK
jgi:cell division protein FtsZ